MFTFKINKKKPWKKVINDIFSLAYLLFRLEWGGKCVFSAEKIQDQYKNASFQDMK